MVEPEVLMDGDHDIDVCYEVTEVALRSLFAALYDQNVMLEGTILKPSMVVSGKDCPTRPRRGSGRADRALPEEHRAGDAAGIVFLSGGQSDEDATAHLNAMNQLGPLPWPLSFSYGRAMQSAALKLWSQDLANNVGDAQKTVFARAATTAWPRWGSGRRRANPSHSPLRRNRAPAASAGVFFCPWKYLPRQL
jgi:fructose-bisphosphate aldolase class I